LIEHNVTIAIELFLLLRGHEFIVISSRGWTQRPRVTARVMGFFSTWLLVWL
jgi:hypothetical protein